MACLLAVAAVSIAAAPIARADGNEVTLGNERIAVSAVPGFDNYTNDPKGQEMAGPLIETNAKLVSFQARLGRFPRYLIVKVAKDLVSQSMSVREFRAITGYSRANLKNQKQYSDLATEQAAERRGQLNATVVPGHDLERIQFDAPVLVGIDRDDDVAFTHTNLVPMTVAVDGERKSTTLVMCASAILVKGKFIIAQLFGPASEVAWARSTCNKFVDDLAAQNP